MDESELREQAAWDRRQEREREERERVAAIESERDQLRADLAAAERTITQLREDAARVHKLLLDYSDPAVPGSNWGDRYRAWKARLASGSSTGEADGEGCQACIDGVAHISCEPYFVPAAPEPAPAPTGWEIGMPNLPKPPLGPAPASAQGTGDPPRAPEETRQVLLGGLAAGRIHLRLDDLDKRVAALEAIEEHIAERAERNRVALQERLDQAKQAAPPQPAPVERHATHAFVPCGCEPNKVCRECGQPRSAAVHDVETK